METRVANRVSQYAVAGIRTDVFSRWPMGRLLIGRDRGRDKCSFGPFPGPASRWQVSTAGGSAPVWSRARAELLFRGADGTLMTAAYTASGKYVPVRETAPLDGRRGAPRV